MSSFSEKPGRCLPVAGARRQRGDILVESLVGLVLMAILGAGVSYLTSRMVVSQRDMKIENLAVTRMRDLLLDQGLALCGTTPTITLPSGEARNLAIACDNVPAVAVTASVVDPAAPATRYLNAPRRVSVRIAGNDLGLPGGGDDIVVRTQ